MPQTSRDAPITVSAVAGLIRSTLENGFGSVWITGEVSNYVKAASGHVYFSLKDERATLRAALFRGVGIRVRFDIRDGLQVIVRGRLTLYEPRGDCQIQIEEILPKGIGPLELAFQQLRQRLHAKAYFEKRRKRPLPRFPRSIALVTSGTGAAIRDMLEMLARRWPIARAIVIPVRVQGDGAAQEIAAAIRLLNQLSANGLSIDAMVIGRGGGSLEDLWAFNEEIVADAIFTSRIPVVSAVGHETDVTISDYVADHRALTPTHAIVDLTPDCADLIASLADVGRRMNEAVGRRVNLARQKLDGLADRRALRQPLDRVRDSERMLDDWDARLRRAGALAVDRANERIGLLAGKLESLSPLNVLARGYSLTQREDGPIVRRAGEVQVGDRIRTRLADGEIISRVEDVR